MPATALPATPPHTVFDYRTYQPLDDPALFEELRILGAKSSDIGDAILQANLDWNAE